MGAKVSLDFDILDRSRKSIAQGALTNSKRPSCFVQGVYPTHLTHGRGCEVWDTKKNRYIDFICGLGVNLLGYGNSEIAQVISDRARLGISLSLGTPTEVEAAEKLCEMFPWVDKVKFLKSGSEACSAAIRIARTFTPNRKVVLSEGYHGWHDSFVSLTPPAIGVADQFEFKKLNGLSDLNESVSAVILEPVITDFSQSRVEWLRTLRSECTRLGIVLIFDEVITGFRFPKMSVANCFGIEPDLICLGKALGNGAPIAAVGGKEAVMNTDYFVSSTYAGDTISLAAAIKVMELLQKKNDMGHLWDCGQRFLTEFNSIWPEGIRIEGYPTRGVFQGDALTKALFWQESCRAGILFGPSWFFNFHHIDHIDSVISIAKDVISRIRTGSVSLLGSLPATPYAQKIREKS